MSERNTKGLMEHVFELDSDVQGAMIKIGIQEADIKRLNKRVSILEKESKESGLQFATLEQTVEDLSDDLSKISVDVREARDHVIKGDTAPPVPAWDEMAEEITKRIKIPQKPRLEEEVAPITNHDLKRPTIPSIVIEGKILWKILKIIGIVLVGALVGMGFLGYVLMQMGTVQLP